MSAEYTIDFWDLADVKLEKRVNEDGYSFLCKKGENNENNLDCNQIKMTVKKGITIYLFPIIKVEWSFKGIRELKKTDYLFLFLCELDKNKDSILIFSNDIVKYFSEYYKKNVKYVGWNDLVRKDKQELGNVDAWDVLDINKQKLSLLEIIEKLTSSFYLFQKEDKEYKWKNILSFFPHFLSSALERENSNAIYKLKWDSIAFFKSRYMQEKTIKTWISEKTQGENLIKSLFYGNLLKNITVKICEKLVDLNGRGKGWFLIPTVKNDETYFEKIEDILEEITNQSVNDVSPLKERTNQSIKDVFPIFFYYNEFCFENNDENENVRESQWENDDLSNLELVDSFPSVFKEDHEWNFFVIDFCDLDNNTGNGNNNTGWNKTITEKRIEKYQQYTYKFLFNNENSNAEKESINVQIGDLFFLLKGREGLFLWKIKCWKKYKMELYKLHTKINEFNIDNIDLINLIKGKNFWKYTVNNGDPNYLNFWGCWFHEQEDNKEGVLNSDGLRYIFSGASLQEEDKLSLWLIRLLNKDGKIYICDKKAPSWELADIIWYKYDEEEEKKMIIHLLHIKTAPFLTENPQTDWYWYYTTAIGQMLQKIEPILWGKIKPFFSKNRSIPVWKEGKLETNNNEKWEEWMEKDDFLEQIGENLEEDKGFLELMDSSEEGWYKDIKKIDLRVGFAFVKEQLSNPINNSTFFMINDILLKWFEYNVKPFLDKEISISFYPIVIQSSEGKS